MPTAAVLTDRERAAVQAYLRLLNTVAAAYDGEVRVVPASVLAEAEQALGEAGLAGNEEGFFRLVRGWCP